MSGSFSCLLAEDHARLDGLLQCAVADAGAINHAAYAAFRAGLLRHIGMEEKVLLPAAQRWRGGVPLPIAAQRRLDHSALAALLAQLQAAPEVPVAPYSDGPQVMSVVRRALARAGYEIELSE
jgi:hypothetical protein